jgi:hypothetical protein
VVLSECNPEFSSPDCRHLVDVRSPEIRAENSVKSIPDQNPEPSVSSVNSINVSDPSVRLTEFQSQAVESTDGEFVIPTVGIGMVQVSHGSGGAGAHPRPKSKPRPMALDLFCGKGSVRRCLEQQGYCVVSVDADARFSPTHVSDILFWNYRQYPPGTFKIISASPPCTEYSRAKTLGWRRLEEADQLVRRTLEIIEYFQPELWWIENPQSGMLKYRNVVEGLPFIDVDYCQFSDWGYQKPTRIWGSDNLVSLGSKVCDGRTCAHLVPGVNGRLRHREQLGGMGMKFGTYQKWRVPEKLVCWFLSVLEQREEKFNFKREDYTVRNVFVQQIEKRFGRRADHDCFATTKNAQCATFYTENDNALAHEWKKGETLWLNPPWSLWRKVVTKLKKIRVRCNLHFS